MSAKRPIVWLAFSGEYEQRNAFAAFASEELARQNSDDVRGLEVWDVPVVTEDHFEWWVRVENGVARNEFPYGLRHDFDWPEWVGEEWGKPISRSDVFEYPRAKPPFILVIVGGNDRAAVEDEVARRLSEIGAVLA